MKLAVFVSEFPKATETFIYRDLTRFRQMGAELRLYHLSPYRKDQTLHGFARVLQDDARYRGFLDGKALMATLGALVTRPSTVLGTVWTILHRYARHPKIAIKSLALVPKSLAIAKELRDWGADHVHAEFAGHPATAAWIGHRVGGPGYSVSCRAHDIFRTQALLAEKLGEAQAVRTVSCFGKTFLHDKLSNGADLEISVIHSSIDTKAIEPTDPAIDPAKPRILYVGALEPKKGVEYLIDALALADKRLGDWRCELIGDGPSAARLKQKAREAGIADRMDFRGMQPFEEVAAAYSRAQVCVAPSIIGPSGRMEGIPNVMIEALANQRPAVATNISGLPELITDFENGRLVPERDAAALAEAIAWVFENPEEATAMVRRGREVVEREFDLSVNAARQMAIFKGEDD